LLRSLNPRHCERSPYGNSTCRARKPVDLRRPEEPLSQAQTNALVKTEAFEAIRLVIPKDHEVCHNHKVDGPITVQCLEGQIAFTADGDTRSVRAGQWLFLPGGVPHTIKGVEGSLMLLTVMFR
jgi:quercetin dioxygenase-like cupin family protein